MSLGLMFSGQGAQHAGMLAWLQPDPVLDALADVVGDDWREHLNDPDWAGRNGIAQAVLTATALAAWRQLADALPTPAAVAGYSVGEVAAFAAAGVFDTATALWLVQRRAAWMERDASAHPAVMVGITGLTRERIEATCKATDLVIAIHNGPDSVVAAGPLAHVQAAIERVSTQGGRAVQLNVNVASHTPYLADAARDFAADLAAVTFSRPGPVLFTNAAGRVRQPDELQAALARQLDHPVQWDACLDGLASRRLRCVLEIGPGQALARMWNARYPDVPARSVDEFQTRQGILDWVARWHDA
ncbi:acyltransferase domain-containing protein [Achromobacter sp. GG226]|uniref:acyltransferase domain-containing protein n=1 Tax=Verticiella alkaliphila TaxID=2779529 RepID=UPI001C0D8207|nr:acyltransferase domain-containing protein [Verticiella sp. GG226]MBU4609601.1 acyltransferase domain-containing protein [Verticiella sp. GG226]